VKSQQMRSGQLAHYVMLSWVVIKMVLQNLNLVTNSDISSGQSPSPK